MTDLIGIDLETTGVDIKQDNPIQIGMVRHLYSEEPFIVMNMFCEPGRDVDPKAQEVHGFTRAMMRDQPSYTIGVWQAAQLLHAYQNDLIVTYNGSQFDLPMLSRISYHDPVFNRLNLDVLDLLYRHYWNLESFKLSAVYKTFFGEEISNAHSAVHDCKASLRIARHLSYQLQTPLTELAEMQRTPRPYEIFPISKKHKGKPLSEVPVSFAKWLRDENIKTGQTMRPDLAASVSVILGCPS